MLYDESISRSKSRKVTIFLFILFIFIFLLIFLWVYNIYRNTTAITTTKTGETTSCWAYSYNIKNMQYQNNTLSFDLENKPYSDGRITKVTIITERVEKSIEIPPLPRGNTRRLVIEDIKVGNKFLAYVENCKGLINEYTIQP